MSNVVTINLEPDEPSLDGHHLNRLIDLWVEDRRANMPPKSATAYANNVRFFQDWWEKVGPAQAWELRQKDLTRFAQSLRSVRHKRTGKPLEYNTRKDILRRLRAAFLWAYRKGYTRHLNLAEWVPSQIDGSARLHELISVEDLARLMIAAGRTLQPVRNQALLATFIGTGARLNEISNLRIEDVALYADTSGVIKIREAKRVRNREIHQRYACFDQHTGKYLRRWLDTLPSSGPLWRSYFGGALTSQGVYKVIRDVAELAQVTITGAHDFRRTFITYFAAQRPGEGNYHLLKLQVGHAQQGITHTLYDLRGIESVRAIFVSPFESMAHLLGDDRSQ